MSDQTRTWSLSDSKTCFLSTTALAIQSCFEHHLWPGCWWNSYQSHRKECAYTPSGMPGSVHPHEEAPKQSKTLLLTARHLLLKQLAPGTRQPSHRNLNPCGPIPIFKNFLTPTEGLHTCQRICRVTTLPPIPIALLCLPSWSALTPVLTQQSCSQVKPFPELCPSAIPLPALLSSFRKPTLHHIP